VDVKATMGVDMSVARCATKQRQRAVLADCTPVAAQHDCRACLAIDGCQFCTAGSQASECRELSQFCDAAHADFVKQASNCPASTGAPTTPGAPKTTVGTHDTPIDDTFDYSYPQPSYDDSEETDGGGISVLLVVVLAVVGVIVCVCLVLAATLLAGRDSARSGPVRVIQVDYQAPAAPQPQPVVVQTE
jgi:hypothetical protein